MSLPRRHVGVGLVLSTALGLGALHVRHAVVAADPVVAAVEAGVPFLLTVVLATAGGWLVYTDLTDAEVWRLAVAVVVGMVASFGVGALTVGHQLLRGETVSHLPFLVANTATAGALCGVLLGVYDARARRGQRRAAAARTTLERERDRLAALFEAAPNPIVHYEIDEGAPVVVEVNGSFERTFGYRNDAVTGESVYDFVLPPDTASPDPALLERLAQGRSVRREVRRRTATGVRSFLLITAPTAHRGGAYGYAFLVDVTERRRREQRLGVLARVLRHDIRNGMNVVVGYADLLRERVDCDDGGDDCEAGAARAIHERGMELLARSEKAREVERLLDGDGANHRTVDVCALAADCAGRAERRHDGLAVGTDLPDAPVYAVGSDLLRVAVDDIADNAAAHGDRDPTSLTVSVRVDEGTVGLRFADDGPGISAAERAVIERHHETPLDHASGLGLWLAAWTVRDLGGDVTFEDNDPRGTVVVLRLPRSAAPVGESAEGDASGRDAPGADADR